MAEDIETNIVINAVGGDGAAAQINQVDAGFKALEGTHKNLQTAFTQKFEHVGLRLFAGDMLRTAGLGREMRPIMSTLQLGLNSVGMAAGASAGPFLLVAAAIAAVVGITSKVIAAQKDHVDALEKTIASNSKQLDSLKEVSSEMDKYVVAGGHLTIAQKTLVDATQKYADVIRTQQITALKDHIAILEANRASIIKHAETLAYWHKYLADVKTVLGFLGEQVKFAMSPLEPMWNLLQKVTGATNDWTKSLMGAGSVKMTAEDTSRLNTELAKNNMELTKAKADLEAVKHGFSGVSDSIKEGTKSLEDKSKSWDKYIENLKKAADIETKLQREINKDKLEQHNKAITDLERASARHAVTEEKINDTVSSDMASGFTDAIDQMMFHGENFAEAFGNAMQKMVEQIIMDIIRMEIEWAIWTAMSGGSGAFFGGAFASGGSVVVDKPTMFMAGEAGPEIATFTPLSQAANSSAGVGQSSSIGQVTINVQTLSGDNPRATLTQLADEMRRQSVEAKRFALAAGDLSSRNSGQSF
jgi:hypothetical protein